MSDSENLLFFPQGYGLPQEMGERSSPRGFPTFGDMTHWLCSFFLLETLGSLFFLKKNAFLQHVFYCIKYVTFESSVFKQREDVLSEEKM